jgi:outer membrane usher protein FimD/PapC
MANIMASATRLACALVVWLLTAAVARASDVAAASTYTPLPGNYSLSYDREKWTDEFSVFHMAVTDPFGTIGAGFAASDDPRLRPLTRLDTAWNGTAPWVGLPVRLGDGVSSASLWDQPARLGGLQIGSFQPALPEIVAPPSIVALPYEIMGPSPVTTTRYIDHLGAMTQFQKPLLQSAGQGDFSLESGRLRENFEVRSDDYGPWITSGSYRYGVNTGTTIDGQVAQVAGQQSFLGLGVLEGLGSLGLVSAKIASSRDPDSSGWLAHMGYDYSYDCLSIAVRSHIQSPGFQNVGDASVIESLRQRTLATAGLDLGSLGRISLASATQTYTDDSRRDIVALSHAMPFAGGGIISTAAAYSPGQLGNSAVLLSFTYPFDYISAPARKINSAVNTALDRTIVDAFGQTRIPLVGRLPTDKLAQQ